MAIKERDCIAQSLGKLKEYKWLCCQELPCGAPCGIMDPRKEKMAEHEEKLKLAVFSAL